MNNVVELGGEPRAVPIDLAEDKRSPVEKLSDNCYTDIFALAEECETLKATITHNAEALAEAINVLNHNADSMESLFNGVERSFEEFERRLIACEEFCGIPPADPTEVVPNAEAFNATVDESLAAA